jgi:predicted AlkP superfamily phosphohydrolase/phosphomutase
MLLDSDTKIVIFLDGADPEYSEKYFEKTQKLVGKVRANPTYDTTTMSTASFLTGLPPGEHGFTKTIGEKTTHLSILKPLIWEKVNCAVAVADLRIVYPACEINGWMIASGVLSRYQDEWAWPPDLQEWLQKIGWIRWPRPRNTLDLKSTDIRFYTEQHTRVYLELLHKRPVELAILGYDTLDIIQHRNEHGVSESPQEWYSLIDEQIAKLATEFSIICILSDHGLPIKTGGHEPLGIFISSENIEPKGLEWAHNFVLEHING